MTEAALSDRREATPNIEQINSDVQMAYGRILMAFEDLKLSEPHGFLRTPKGDYDRFRFTKKYSEANRPYRQVWENRIHGAAENFPWPLNKPSAKVILGETRRDGLQLIWTEGQTRYWITLNPEGKYAISPEDESPSFSFTKTLVDQEGYTVSSESQSYHNGKINKLHLEVKTWDPSNFHDLDINEPDRPDRIQARDIIRNVKEHGSFIGSERVIETSDANLESLQSSEAWTILIQVVNSLEQAASTT